MTKSIESIAGMSLGGGRKENFFFSLIEFFPKEDRWFLTSLKQLKDETHLSQDEVIHSWIENSKANRLVVDFPLSKPPCETCQLNCPGMENCPQEVVISIKNVIEDLLSEDTQRMTQNPKRYEQERVEDNLVHYSRSVLAKETQEHILSKSFKRKLKKGFTPYWNRPIDFWIWLNYYDQMLKTFNSVFDSFGNVSVMILHKFQYLLRHLPPELVFYESSVQITLLELYRAGIIDKKNILELNDHNVSTLARVRVAKRIEEKLKIFIYNKDLDLISKNPKAFDSFLLAIAGHSLLKGNNKKVPESLFKDNSNFLLPQF